MLIKRNNIETLAQIQFTTCISLYIPTHRSGFENSKIDHLNFKNALSEAKIKMEKMGIPPNEIHILLQPAYELLDDAAFWTRLSDGLAVFISADHFEYFELPLSFDNTIHIGQEFYLRPLLPMFAGDGRYFLLALSQNEVRFFEGSRHSITPVIINDLVPKNLEETLTYSELESSLQLHSGNGNMPLYHGQGSGHDRKNTDLMKYFRQVDHGLMKMLHDENVPLLIAAVDYLVPLYREVSNYSNIMDFHITGNPEFESPVQLHEKSWSVIEPYFKKEQLKAKEKFNTYFPKNQASISIKNIVPASINGRVESLFISKEEPHMWGFYNRASNQVKLHKKHRKHSDCLVNLAAIKTFLQGGNVYNVRSEEMPYPYSSMNAVYRY